jgi:hypothetical protein
METCRQTYKSAQAPLGEVLVFDALYEAYPNLAKLPVKCVPESLVDDSSIAWVTDDLSSSYVRERQESEAEQHSHVFHETQHLVQTIEGFSKGTSISTQFTALAKQWRDLLQDQAPELPGSRFNNFAYLCSTKQRGRLIQFAEKVIQKPENFLDSERIAVTKHPACRDFLRNLQKAALENYMGCAGEVEARATEARRTWSPEKRKATKPPHAYSREAALRATGIPFGVFYEPRHMTLAEAFQLTYHDLRPERPQPRTRLAGLIYKILSF